MNLKLGGNVRVNKGHETPQELVFTQITCSAQYQCNVPQNTSDLSNYSGKYTK